MLFSKKEKTSKVFKMVESIREITSPVIAPVLYLGSSAILVICLGIFLIPSSANKSALNSKEEGSCMENSQTDVTLPNSLPILNEKTDAHSSINLSGIDERVSGDFEPPSSLDSNQSETSIQPSFEKIREAPLFSSSEGGYSSSSSTTTTWDEKGKALKTDEEEKAEHNTSSNNEQHDLSKGGSESSSPGNCDWQTPYSPQTTPEDFQTDEEEAEAYIRELVGEVSPPSDRSADGWWEFCYEWIAAAIEYLLN